MPKNLTGKQAGLVNGSPTNDPSVRVIRGSNQFPQSFMHPSTCRYGEVDPVMFFKAERHDTIPYKFVTDLNTYTMASPMKSEVNMYSAAFKVPMQAIYPRNWEIMLAIPNKGDDVPDDTRCLFNLRAFASALMVMYNAARSSDGDSVVSSNALIRAALLLEYCFSAGSLFSKFNYHFDAVEFIEHGKYYDDFIDTQFVPWLKDKLTDNDIVISHIDSETSSYKVVSDVRRVGNKLGVDTYAISFRRALELLRTGEYVVSSIDLSDSPNLTWRLVTQIPNMALNIEPIVSYQIACSHFFTNPKIDYVYSVELYRDNMQSLVYGEDGRVPTFSWNGLIKQYDVFSQKVLTDALAGLSINSDMMYYHTAFWFNLFQFHRSLRYGDYFTGVHPEPIAPGDINAPVVDGSVSAIDMTKKLQMARLLNKINITGPRMIDQLVALFGGKLPEAPKDVPVRLSLEKFNVSGFEVNNTGEMQADAMSSDNGNTNITTTNLRLNESKFMFEAQIDEPCYIIVVQYFDAHRIYSRTLTRFALHTDRFDDFIPDLQFEGDQDVKRIELDATSTDLTPFAYNLRYMEYKQSVSYASGGFIRALKSWAFITDNNDGNPPQERISPDYIRSSPSEFDRFYSSLTGWSLGTYFHFITTNTNVIAPYRQMVYAPEILA